MSEGTIWYEVNFSSSIIVPTTVLQETDKYVIVHSGGRQRRQIKDGTIYAFRRTWEEAHQLLVIRAEHHVISAERSLERKRERVVRIKGMVKP